MPETLSGQRQLSALCSLFAVYARFCLDVQEGNGPNAWRIRSARLAWASDQLGRPIASFTELRPVEARRLTAVLKQSLRRESKQARRFRDRQAAIAAAKVMRGAA